MQWAQEQQADIIESLPKDKAGLYDLSKITFYGGVYSDSGGTTGLENRFRELLGVGREETVGRSKQDNTVESGLDDEILYAGREGLIWLECEEIEEEFNERMRYFTVGFRVDDDGAGDFYITPTAELKLSFYDFERLPNRQQAFDVGNEAIHQMNDYPYASDGTIKEIFNNYPRVDSVPSRNVKTIIVFTIDVEPEMMEGMLGHGFVTDPDGFSSFCEQIDKLDDLESDHDVFSKIFEKLFKRDGWMSGGAFINWANELVIDSNLYYEWSYDVEDSYDGDHFGSIDIYTSDTYVDLSEYISRKSYKVRWDTSGAPIKAFIDDYPVAYVYRADDGSFEVTESDNMNGYYKSFGAAKAAIEAGYADNEFAYDKIKRVLESRDFSIALKKKLVGPHLDETGHWPPNWSVDYQIMPSDDEVEIVIRMEADSDAPDSSIHSMRETVEEWDDEDELRAAVKEVIDTFMKRVSNNKQSKEPLSESKRIVDTWKEFLRA